MKQTDGIQSFGQTASGLVVFPFRGFKAYIEQPVGQSDCRCARGISQPPVLMQPALKGTCANSVRAVALVPDFCADNEETKLEYMQHT
jgi:hypothetical protein